MFVNDVDIRLDSSTSDTIFVNDVDIWLDGPTDV